MGFLYNSLQARVDFEILTAVFNKIRFLFSNIDISNSKNTFYMTQYSKQNESQL